MKDVNLGNFSFTGIERGEISDLRTLDASDKHRILYAGVDLNACDGSAVFMHMDQSTVHCKSHDPGLELLDFNVAMKRYGDLPEYAWKLVDRDKDEFTRNVAENTHGGYFIRTRPGAKIEKPVQSCLFLKADGAGQNVHNIVVVEEGSELHIMTGCSTAHSATKAAHLGITEYYVKRGGKLTFTMVHNWGENATVRPRSVGVVEEGGVFQSNYVLLNPVGTLQMYPAIHLNGRGAVARFNSIIVTPEGSHVDSGNRVIMNAPDTRCEIISRTITTGGVNIARGHIAGHAVPCRGHLECKGLILGGGQMLAIPELDATVEGVDLSHEAAVGKIAQDEIEYLMARGMDEAEATSTIVRGFLNVDIMGLDGPLAQAIQEQVEQIDAGAM
ncbi:MAG: SufD family Fe-S cluster assembly protein [Proteobacteria bacterium]|nr:SufD family Fe-S cluster assembly protein [Pseudomonadota bacterium]MBU1595285.1 SufD family Fe-S cluster assembly protein [Pseudomonadota bacterium]